MVCAKFRVDTLGLRPTGGKLGVVSRVKLCKYVGK
jgi:hypothetical protein